MDARLKETRKVVSILRLSLIPRLRASPISRAAGSTVIRSTILAPNSELATIVRINYDQATNAVLYTPLVFPGGASSLAIGSSPHSDTRALTIDANENLIPSDDGGLYAFSQPQGGGNWTSFGGSAPDAVSAIEAYSAVMDPITGRLGFAAQDDGAGFSPLSNGPGTVSQSAWSNVLNGDGMSVTVNAATAGGVSIFYATVDGIYLARVLANESLSQSSPPPLYIIDVSGKNETFFDYQNTVDGATTNNIEVAVNAIDPSRLLLRSTRLYEWSDSTASPVSASCLGSSTSCSIDITDISSGQLFGSSLWSEKIAYGTQDAPHAILAGGPLPTNNGYGVYFCDDPSANNPVGSANLLSAYANLRGGSPGDPISVLFDPATAQKYFVADTYNVYGTSNGTAAASSVAFSTLALPVGFQNPTGLGYLASETGGAINGVKALLIGGIQNAAIVGNGNAPGNIIATENPFPINPASSASFNWINLAAGLPNLQIQDLHYYPTIDALVAATYGRGVWVLYDVTSNFPDATQLWFGMAGNNSKPNPSLLTDGVAANGSTFSRPLDKFGPGTLTLSGNPTFSGGAFIEGGMVAITSDANLGAPRGGITFANCTVGANLCGGGALQFDEPVFSARPVSLQTTGTFDTEADATLSGVISGVGALAKIGPGTLTLTGNNSYVGGTFVQAGTLAIGRDATLGDPSGQIGLNAATLQATSSFVTARTVAIGAGGATIDTNADAMLTGNGLWAAQGTLTKTGSGTLALNDLAWLQNVTVANGSLQVDGSLTGTSIVVNQGGTLSGSGKIGAPTMVSGTLSPGPALGTLTFTAPVVLQSGSTLAISIDGASSAGGAGSYSQLVVNGAGLAVGGALAPTFRGIAGGNNTFTPSLGEQFGIVSATGGIVGQFAGISQTGDGLPWTTRLDVIYGPNTITLAATPTFFSLAPLGTPSWSFNQASVGTTLDLLRPTPGKTTSNPALQALYDTLYGYDGPQLAQAMTGLSAQSEAIAAQSALDALQAVHNALQSHLLGNVSACAPQPSLGLDGGGRSLAASLSSGPSTCETGSGGGRFWATPFVQSYGEQASGGIPGIAATVGGLIAGLESPIGGGRTIGAAAAGAHEAGSNASSSSDLYTFMAYGRQNLGPLLAAAYAGYSRNFVTSGHNFGILGPSANENGAASSFLAGGALAYAFDLQGFVVTPTAMAAFTQMNLSGVGATSSGGIPFFVPSQSVSELTLTLGPAVSRTWTAESGARISARIAGGWLYEENPYVTLEADLFGLATSARSAMTSRNGAFAEFGLESHIARSVNVYVAWRGEARPRGLGQPDLGSPRVCILSDHLWFR